MMHLYLEPVPVARVTRAALAPPVNLVAPTLLVTSVAVADPGPHLAVSAPGAWASNPTSFAYLWKRSDGTAPANTRTSTTYTLLADDVGWQLYCTVTATNASGTGTADTTLSPAVTAT